MNRQPTVGGVLIDGQDAGVIVRRALVEKAESEHEKATLFLRSNTTAIDFTQQMNKRIEFTYGLPGNIAVFQGYVAIVNPQQYYTESNQSIFEQEMTCLGPSMVLKGNRPRFFTNVTATAVMASIVADADLGFNDEYHQDETTWRQLAQTQETDWEMLVALSNRIGVHVVVTRGVVRMVDYYDIAYRALPTYTFQRNPQVLPPSQDNDTNRGTVVEFSPANYATSDPAYRTPEMAFLANGTAVKVSAMERPGPVPNRFSSSMPVLSPQEALTIQSGMYLPGWSQEGTLTVSGDASIEPACMVQVNSMAYGTKTVRTADFDGLWYVKKVTHSYVGQRFMTELEVGRPQGRASNWYQTRPFWMGNQRGIPQLIGSGTGSWISTWR